MIYKYFYFDQNYTNLLKGKVRHGAQDNDLSRNGALQVSDLKQAFELEFQKNILISGYLDLLKEKIDFAQNIANNLQDFVENNNGDN